MTDHEPPLDELPEGLRDLIAGIVNDPVPAELTEHVRERLRRSHPRPVSSVANWRLAAVLVMASAATIAAIAIILKPGRPLSAPSKETHVFETERGGAAPLTTDFDAPSLWAYHRAAANSFEAVDALLNRHAATVLPPESQPSLSLSPHPFRSFEETF